MRMRRLSGLSIAALAALVLVVMVGTREAEAQCTVGTCDSSYCEYDCPTGADYLVFGSIWSQSTVGGSYYWRGIGVCRFSIGSSYSKGTYQDYTARTTNTADYRVRADGNQSTGGGDALRLAAPSGEWCRAASGSQTGVQIYGALPDSTDTFLFWGDYGDDQVWLCSVNAPVSSNCISNAGRADGRPGTDEVCGSVYADDLWGMDGNDSIYGYAGNDELYGGSDNDTLYGGTDSDTLYGDSGDDTLRGDWGFDSGSGSADTLYGGAGADDLRGEEGCDYLDGGSGTESRCQCGYSDTWGEGSATITCENPSNCPGCLTMAQAQPEAPATCTASPGTDGDGGTEATCYPAR